MTSFFRFSRQTKMSNQKKSRGFSGGWQGLDIFFFGSKTSKRTYFSHFFTAISLGLPVFAAISQPVFRPYTDEF